MRVEVSTHLKYIVFEHEILIVIRGCQLDILKIERGLAFTPQAAVVSRDLGLGS